MNIFDVYRGDHSLVRFSLKKAITIATVSSLSLSSFPAFARDEISSLNYSVDERVEPSWIDQGLVDSDGDGLPDDWEINGVTLSNGEELPLHLWGVDPHKKDLFLEVYWDDSGKGFVEPDTEILDDIVNLFAQNDINLHIDAGDHYSNIEHMAVRNGGPKLNAEESSVVDNDGSQSHVNNKLRELRGSRAGIFRAMGLVERGEGAKIVGSGGGTTFYVSVNGDDLANKPYERHHIRRTTLHEFGHTLGLGHFGTYKVKNHAWGGKMFPNYRSAMSYIHRDVFDFTHERVTSDQYQLECADEKRCDTKTPYDIPADWDSLDFLHGWDNRGVGRTGVSIETERRTLSSPAMNSHTLGPIPTMEEIAQIFRERKSSAEVAQGEIEIIPGENEPSETESTSTTSIAPEPTMETPVKDAVVSEHPGAHPSEPEAETSTEPSPEQDEPDEDISQEPSKDDNSGVGSNHEIEGSSSSQKIVLGVVGSLLAIVGALAAFIGIGSHFGFPRF